MQRMDIDGDLSSGGVGGKHLVLAEIQRQLRHRNVDLPNTAATPLLGSLAGWYALGDRLKASRRIYRDAAGGKRNRSCLVIPVIDPGNRIPAAPRWQVSRVLSDPGGQVAFVDRALPFRDARRCA